MNLVIYSVQSPSKCVPKKKATKIFAKQAAPAWFPNMGVVSSSENGTWDLALPDVFVAHVAGHSYTTNKVPL